MFDWRLPRVSSLFLAVFALAALTASADRQPWPAVVEAARGETVYFHAWGGSDAVNRYLRWADGELRREYGVRLRHVKVNDIAQAVQRLRTDQRAGLTEGGAIDLVWINGENFHALKRARTLEPDLLDAIPNAANLLTDQLPLLSDFGVPVEGLEVPWGVGQFNLIARRDALPERAVSPQMLLRHARRNPGRFTYPRPPDFVGTTFLKSLLQALTDGDPRLYRAVDEQSIAALLPQLWDYLDRLHPLLWQQADAFPQSAAQQLQWLADGQVSVAFSFNPREMQARVRDGRLPETVSQHYFSRGAITNSHYLAIPRNATHKAAARVAINFLISERAQARKADTRHWGDPAVVRLPDGGELLPTAPELHASWQDVLESRWLARYQ